MLPFTAFKLIDEVSCVNPMEASGARWGKMIPRQCCVEICSVIFTACVTRYWHSRQLALGFFSLLVFAAPNTSRLNIIRRSFLRSRPDLAVMMRIMARWGEEDRLQCIHYRTCGIIFLLSMTAVLTLTFTES